MANDQTRFTYVPVRVTRGELTVFYLQTTANTLCAVAATSTTGEASLGTPASQTSDREGNLRIAWTLASDAPPGRATLTVRCNADTVTANFTVV